MNKNISIKALVLVVLAASCTRDISPEQAERFVKFYGNQYMDEARDLEIMDDGSYAICGIDSVQGEGKRAVLIVTDKFGNVKQGFPKYYSDGSYPSAANTLVLQRGGEGGFLLSGYSEKPVVDTAPIETGLQKDIFLVRTDKSGGVLWSESFGSEEDESVLHATQDFGTGYMLAGYQEKDGKRDIMIMGVTDQGDSSQLGLNYSGSPLIETSSANYILNTGEQYLAVCTYDRVGSAGTDILILNFDRDLSPVVKPLSNILPETGNCVAHIEGDRYVVLGNRTSASGLSELVLYEITIDGILITGTVPLAQISESGAQLVASRIKKSPNGGFVVVGTRVIGSNRDIFLQFLDESFQSQERIIFGEAGNQSGEDVEFASDAGMLMLGTNGAEDNSMISLIRTGEAGELE